MPTLVLPKKKTIVIEGMPGSGKTTLLKALVKTTGATGLQGDPILEYYTNKLGVDLNSDDPDKRRAGLNELRPYAEEQLLFIMEKLSSGQWPRLPYSGAVIHSRTFPYLYVVDMLTSSWLEEIYPNADFTVMPDADMQTLAARADKRGRTDDRNYQIREDAYRNMMPHPYDVDMYIDNTGSKTAFQVKTFNIIKEISR